MTTINSQEDFLRALTDNPEWKAAVRTQILGEELMQLPAKFDAFVQQMTESVAELKEINKRITARLDSLDNNVGRLIDESGWLKGYVTRQAAIRDAPVIAIDMGLDYVRTVTTEELYRMALNAAKGEPLSNDLRSFRRADLVIEATDGETAQYIAVEASFVGGAHDTFRATRNASFLTDFTGQPARAAIASVRNHDSANWYINSGAVYWHEIEERELRSE